MVAEDKVRQGWAFVYPHERPVGSSAEPAGRSLKPLQVGVEPAVRGLKPVEVGVEPDGRGWEPVRVGVEPPSRGSEPVEVGGEPTATGDEQWTGAVGGMSRLSSTGGTPDIDLPRS